MAKTNDSTNLRKLRKRDLLEIMLAQSREIDELRKQVEELEKQVEDKKIAISKAGSLAEASLAVTKIFEEAQKAADLYLENVKEMTGSGGGEPDES